MTSRPRQWLDYGLLYGLFLLARPLPRPWLLAVGRGVGAFVWHVVRFRRDVVLDNIRQAFGHEMNEEQIRDTARRFYRQLGMTLMEFLAFPRLDSTDILELAEIQGQEYFDQVVSAGQGGLLVSGHFGNWELLGARVVAAGHKVNFIVKSQANARVDRVQNDIRARAGIGIIRSGKNIKDMILALRRQEFIGLLADQDAGKDGVFCSFLGRPASVFRGTAYLAWKLKCPIVTGHILRLDDGRHRVIIDPPVFPDPEWDEETAVTRLTEIHVQRLEAAVRMAPEHYFWLHRRWKTRPPEEKS
jgi:KDO2-lipid IV(A) lauroyltransferase